MTAVSPRYRALLIGVAEYHAAGIPPLPFVPADLKRLGDALRNRGFHEVVTARDDRLTLNGIRGSAAEFLQDSVAGDHLLIVLSGHGVHFNGGDYLVPEDAHPQVTPFASGCVKIDWQAEIDRSPAAQVVFLVDACREGISESIGDDVMNVSAWGEGQAAAVARRKVASLFACSRAEYARFVRESDTVRPGHTVKAEPGESYSLFSRAVSDLLDEGVDGRLDAFVAKARERVAHLHTAYGKKGDPQYIRVSTETEREGFRLFPPPQRGPADDRDTAPAERTWPEAVARHQVWACTDRTSTDRREAVTAVKAACRALAAHFGRIRDRAEADLADDPWYDRELAERTADRLGFLLRRLPDGTRLSPTEAGVLALLPFAAQAHWARLATRDGGAPDLPEAELDDFLQAFPRLRRRLHVLKQNGSPAVRDIRRWGHHRWLVQRRDAFDPAVLGCDTALAEPGWIPRRGLHWTAANLAWIREELTAEHLTAHLKEQRMAPAAAPGTVRSTTLDAERVIASSTGHEHLLREQLVSALYKAAHALAIDPADLPEVLVEHLGISDSVELPALLATLRDSRWQPSGAGRSLHATCRHPAVELALRRHAEAVDTLLRDINREAGRENGALAPHRSLPAYADAHQVGPGTGTPSRLSTGIRFRLADDRVQELLMGERLYGERALAIRELYQNALDALRYRTARTEYLQRRRDALPPDERHRHPQLPPWEGKVVFTEGTDDAGRPYLACRDNGIGMGVTELSQAFSRGGSRFVDLPEYLEEGALWASLDPPVRLLPVSRFGLGVLSYFMIADELTVETCRLDRAGHPGDVLRVTIAGPGNLFRVESLGPGGEGDVGTTVRLIGRAGRPMPSSGEELWRCLWVSPYRVEAPRGGGVGGWEPGKGVPLPHPRKRNPDWKRRKAANESSGRPNPSAWPA
ncbi:peptidase C14 caspase catalytic subunit p20, partial [Actinobacteria bacterium OK074]